MVHTVGRAAPPRPVPHHRLRARARGGPLPGLNDTELAEFKEGFDAFRSSLSRDQGLGPAYNLASGYPCHGHPALGGQSPKTVTRFGRAAGDVFQALDSAGGSLLQQKAIGSDCAEVIPAAANVVIRRNATSALGAGLIEAIPSSSRRDFTVPAVTARSRAWPSG
jgi:hypothetical protein